MNQEQFAHVFALLADAMQDESDKKHLGTVEQLVAEYNHLDLKQPEQFGLLMSLTQDEQRDLLARIVLSDTDVTERQFEALSFVYTQYTFVEQHLERLIERFEGIACSSDKTRWLVDNYVNFLVTGNMPEIQERKFWHPRLTDVELWFNWAHTFQTLYDGDEMDYVRYKQQIEYEYKENVLKNLISTAHNTLITHKYYTGISQEEKYGEMHAAYQFVDPSTQDKGTILLNSRAEMSYRYFIENKQCFATRKDPLPEWFQTLIR